jgi:hypothetical protein
MSKMSRRIVVDASVAASAGEGEHPASARCRGFLLDMLTICHRVTMSAEIMTEWDNHASPYSIRWLAAMRGKGKVLRVNPEPGTLMEAIRNAHDWQVKEFAAMEKDLLLVLAALASDRVVASRDERVRKLFAKAAANVHLLTAIAWVDPATADDHHGEWLRAGARHTAALKLGAAV